MYRMRTLRATIANQFKSLYRVFPPVLLMFYTVCAVIFRRRRRRILAANCAPLLPGPPPPPPPPPPSPQRPRGRRRRTREERGRKTRYGLKAHWTSSNVMIGLFPLAAGVPVQHRPGVQAHHGAQGAGPQLAQEEDSREGNILFFILKKFPIGERKTPRKAMGQEKKTR